MEPGHLDQLPYIEDLELDDPADDLEPCEWVGHCTCYHEGDQCCSCGEMAGDFSETVVD